MTIEINTIDLVCRIYSRQSSKEDFRIDSKLMASFGELSRAPRRCSRTRRESHLPRDEQKAGRRFQWESKASLARMSSALLLCHTKNPDAPSAVTLLRFRRGRQHTRAFPIGHLDFFLRSPSSKTTRLVR